MQTMYSPGVGLMPDFIVNTDTATPVPRTGFIGDGNDKEGLLLVERLPQPVALRVRLPAVGRHALEAVTGRMIDFFQQQLRRRPDDIGTGYALDGTQLTGGNSAAYHGPICAGACVDAQYQAFLDAMWNWNASHLTTGYYDGEIQLLSMVVASGNWWSPINVGSGFRDADARHGLCALSRMERDNALFGRREGNVAGQLLHCQVRYCVE